MLKPIGDFGFIFSFKSSELAGFFLNKNCLYVLKQKISGHRNGIFCPKMNCCTNIGI